MLWILTAQVLTTHRCYTRCNTWCNTGVASAPNGHFILARESLGGGWSCRLYHTHCFVMVVCPLPGSVTFVSVQLGCSSPLLDAVSPGCHWLSSSHHTIHGCHPVLPVCHWSLRNSLCTYLLMLSLDTSSPSSLSAVLSMAPIHFSCGIYLSIQYSSTPIE